MSDITPTADSAEPVSAAPPPTPEPATLADASHAARERLALIDSDTSDATPGAPPPSPWEQAGKTPETLWNDNLGMAQHLRDNGDRWQRYDAAFGALHPDDATFLLEAVDAIARRDGVTLAQYAPELHRLLEDMAEEFDPFDPANIDKRTEAVLERKLAEREQQAQAEREHKERLTNASKQVDADIADLVKTHGLTDADARDLWQHYSRLPQNLDTLERITQAAAKLVGSRPQPAERKPNDLRGARQSAGARIASMLLGSEPKTAPAATAPAKPTAKAPAQTMAEARDRARERLSALGFDEKPHVPPAWR